MRSTSSCFDPSIRRFRRSDAIAPFPFALLARDAAPPACVLDCVPVQVREREEQLQVDLLEEIEKTRKPVGWIRPRPDLGPPGLDQLISDFIDENKEAWMQKARACTYTIWGGLPRPVPTR